MSDPVDQARRRFVAARAAVRVALIGPDVHELARDKERGRWAVSVINLERVIAAYLVVTAGTSQEAAAQALGTSSRVIRRWRAVVEAWRSAPVVDQALTRIEAALPRDP